MKPILFNTEMVRAILEGRKTCTRRVIKDKDITNAWDCEEDGTPFAFIDRDTGDSYPPTFPCRYQPGDILYVRETWAKSMAGTYMYRATDTPLILDRWRPSIHMPKEAARIFLRVTDVRVERLQDITEKQAMEEGIGAYWILGTSESGYAVNSDSKTLYEGPIGAFSALWNSTIKGADLDSYGWAANPWVWVIEFEQCKKPEED